jgi:hypothetical protein
MPNDSEANGISKKTTPDEAAVVISQHMNASSLLIIKCGAGGSRAYVGGSLIAAQPAFVASLLDSTGTVSPHRTFLLLLLIPLLWLNRCWWRIWFGVSRHYYQWTSPKTLIDIIIIVNTINAHW